MKHWRNCGTACPISCETRNRPPGLCDSRCVPGCFCKIPYILETAINWQQQPVRCILPAQCPLLGTAGGSIVALPIVPIDLGGGGGYVQQPSNCDDPLKEFRACGSACAPGCGAGRNERVCAPQCVAGCFCRHPYILADANDRRSACVLEQQCGPVRGDGDQQPDQQSCNDPRKEWSTCGSTCPRSCLNLEPTCDSQHCVQVITHISYSDHLHFPGLFLSRTICPGRSIRSYVTMCSTQRVYRSKSLLRCAKRISIVRIVVSDRLQ